MMGMRCDSCMELSSLPSFPPSLLALHNIFFQLPNIQFSLHLLGWSLISQRTTQPHRSLLLSDHKGALKITILSQETYSLKSPFPSTLEVAAQTRSEIYLLSTPHSPAAPAVFQECFEFLLWTNLCSLCPESQERHP